MANISAAYSAAALAALALGPGAPFTAALQNHGINEYAAPAMAPLADRCTFHTAEAGFTPQSAD